MLVEETSSGSRECLLRLLPLLCAGLGGPPRTALMVRLFLSSSWGGECCSPHVDTPNLHTDPRRRPAPAPAWLSLAGAPLLLQKLPSHPGHLGVHRPRAGRGRVFDDRGSWARLTQQVGVVPAPPERTAKHRYALPPKDDKLPGTESCVGGKLRSDTCGSLTSINASMESRCGFLQVPWPHCPPWLPGPGQELYGRVSSDQTFVDH